MRKSDDDLKIDIADLFGEELPSPSDAIEDAAPAKPQAATAPPGPDRTPSEAEAQFKEWMDNRNSELETKVRELEMRLQELKQQPAPPPPPPLVVPAVPPQESAGSPAKASAVDFDAPISAPFAGQPPAVPSDNAAPASPVDIVSGGQETPQDPHKIEELRRLQADHEFLMLYDEFRNILLHELKDLVGEKKTYTMLERTVEMARGKFPEVFRNANWDTEGNLLEDGSVDSQRIIENKNALEAGKADATVDAALSALLSLRLQAVEKGLGAGLRNKIRARMYQWITEKINRAQKEGKDTAFLKRLGSYVV
jgi:hypothetical protein